MSVLIVATLTPGGAVLSFAGNAVICSTDVGVLVLLTRNNLPSSLLRATALPAAPTVAVVTDAVGLVVSAAENARTGRTLSQVSCVLVS